MKDINQLMEKLKLLSKSDYDVDLFQYQKNTIIGIEAVKKIANLNIQWTGPYSVEIIPQHWLYYLMLVLKQDNHPLYLAIKHIEDINIDALESFKQNKVIISGDKLDEVVKLILLSDVFDVIEKVELGVKVRKELNGLIAERVREKREIMIDIENIKSSN